MQETLLTAARRIVRFIRIDDAKEGGLLSVETIQANEVLGRMVENELTQERFDRVSRVAEISKVNGEYFVRFDQSEEAVSFGAEMIPLRIGDEVTITIRKR